MTFASHKKRIVEQDGQKCEVDAIAVHCAMLCLQPSANTTHTMSVGHEKFLDQQDKHKEYEDKTCRPGHACMSSEYTARVAMASMIKVALYKYLSVVFGSLAMGQMMTPLTFGSWQKARRRGCNAGEVCARRLFFFSGCTWKSTGVYTQCVCQVTIERYLAFTKLGFHEGQSTVASFSSQVLFQTSDAPT